MYFQNNYVMAVGVASVAHRSGLCLSGSELVSSTRVGRGCSPRTETLVARLVNTLPYRRTTRPFHTDRMRTVLFCKRARRYKRVVFTGAR